MRVHEIFTGYSGEAGIIPQGSQCLFVRFAGCNLRCTWCDTKRTWEEKQGIETSPSELLRLVHEVKNPSGNMILTGGEPLLQPHEDLIEFLRGRYDDVVQVETNGTIAPSRSLMELVDCWVVDYKPKSSGRVVPVAIGFFNLLERNDIIKCVVGDEVDMDEAVSFLHEIKIPQWFPPSVYFSPLNSRARTNLPDWIAVRDVCFVDGRRPRTVGINIQIHKEGGWR